MLKKIKRNLSILLAAAAVLYLGLSFCFDSSLIISALRSFNFAFTPLIVLLALLNLSVRFVRWNYLIRRLNIKLAIKDSAGIFFSNLIMLATPGAVGEFYKSYMLKMITNEPMSKTAPIIFTERLNDFIVLTILSFTGAIIFGGSLLLVIIAASFFAGLIIILTNETITIKIINRISQIKFLNKYLGQMSVASGSFHEVLELNSLLLTLPLSFLSWMFECLTVHFVLFSLGINTEFLWTIFAYAFSILFGSLSALPAGMGVTEGSLIFFISNIGFKLSTAVAAAFVIRLITLWFAVLIGSLTMMFWGKRFDDLEDINK